MRCEDTSRYLSPYLDSELDPRTSFEMSSHFEQCGSCRGRFEAERRIDHAISVELKKSESGDEERWNRARSRATRPSGRGGLWALFLLGVIGCATAMVVLRPRLSVGLAQELRSAFIAFEAGRSKLDVVGSNSKTIEAFCHDQLGLAIHVPVKVGSFEIEGARKCSLRGATSAFLSYRESNRRIAVIVFNADHLDRFPASDRIKEPSLDETQDLRVVVLRSGWKVVGVTGAVSADELATAGRAFQD